ncbi:MAG: Acetolactate synthase large subunit, partial [uncultured Thermomicrobiales bacterium]
ADGCRHRPDDQRGVPPGRVRPPRPGPRRHPEERLHRKRAVLLPRERLSPRLPADPHPEHAPGSARGRGDQRGEEAAHHGRARNLALRRDGDVRPLRRAVRDAGHLHAPGSRLLPRGPSPRPRDDGDARPQARQRRAGGVRPPGQYRGPLRRPRHRPHRRLRPQSEGGPRRHRPRRDRQERRYRRARRGRRSRSDQPLARRDRGAPPR